MYLYYTQILLEPEGALWLLTTDQSSVYRFSQTLRFKFIVLYLILEKWFLKTSLFLVLHWRYGMSPWSRIVWKELDLWGFRINWPKAHMKWKKLVRTAQSQKLWMTVQSLMWDSYNNGAGAATISTWEWVDRVPSGGIRRMEGCHNGIELTIE